MPNGVLVTGTGSASAAPDVLRVSLGVQAKAADVASALDSASAALRSVLDVLRASGVADTDVRTANLSVQESWAPTGAVDGYQCQQQVQIVVRDLDGSGRLLRELAGAGGDRLRINDVSLDVSDRSAAAERARAAAFADAQARAGQYAVLSGRRLGTVVLVEEVNGAGVGGWRTSSDAMFAEAVAASVPVAQGQLEVTVSVRVRWGLLG